MKMRDQSVTVRENILHTANVVGAVHPGRPRQDVNRLLEQYAGAISVGGYRPDVRSLQAIARVTLRALEPLREGVRTAATQSPPTTRDDDADSR
jgi:hypothetical protein